MDGRKIDKLLKIENIYKLRIWKLKRLKECEFKIINCLLDLLNVAQIVNNYDLSIIPDSNFHYWRKLAQASKTLSPRDSSVLAFK
jgi:hypothetical protein